VRRGAAQYLQYHLAVARHAKISCRLSVHVYITSE
jgi:hypothetical protein